jgi:thermostable 8-oxoguanine DNA glycosylase
MEKEITLEEIRIAQNKTLEEMAKEGLTHSEQLGLENASFHLRNLERLLVATLGKNLIADLKNETMALNALTEEMNRTSKKLSDLTVILRKIVKITGQVIDILDLVK